MELIYKAVIPVTPVTKKNHQQILKTKPTREHPKGRMFVAPSKEYKAYEQACMPYLANAVVPFGVCPIDFPVCVECKFVMPTKRLCDLTNLLESIDDVLVKAGILADDNYKIIESHDGSRVLYDKDNGHTELRIYRI